MTSKTIDDFLRFLREKEQEYRMAYDEVHEKNYYQQDMLHDVEMKRLENAPVPEEEKVAFYDELGCSNRCTNGCSSRKRRNGWRSWSSCLGGCGMRRNGLGDWCTRRE